MTLCTCPGDEEGAGPEEPALKRQRERLDYLQSPEFQRILSAKSRHTGALQAVRPLQKTPPS